MTSSCRALAGPRSRQPLRARARQPPGQQVLQRWHSLADGNDGGDAGAAGTNVDLDGFDLPRSGFGSSKAERRQAEIPDTRNDENLAVAQTHLAFIRFHNRMVEKLASRGNADRLAVRGRAQARRQALPVDDPHRFPAAHRRSGHRQRRIHQRPQVFRGHSAPGRGYDVYPSCGCSRATCRRCRSSSRWRRIGSATAWSAPATVEPDFPHRRPASVAARWSCCSGSPAPAASSRRRPPMRAIRRPETSSGCPPTGSPISAGFTTSAKPGGTTSKVADTEFNPAQRIDTLLVNPLATLPLGSFGGRGTNPPRARAQPRLPQSHAGADGGTGDRAADGADDGRHAADRRPDPQRQRRRGSGWPAASDRGTR